MSYNSKLFHTLKITDSFLFLNKIVHFTPDMTMRNFDFI